MPSPSIRIADGVGAGGDGAPLLLIAGPDVVESEEHCLRMARALADVARTRGVPLVFKASFDKANRTSAASYRGPGLREGLRVLEARGRVSREVRAEVVRSFGNQVHRMDYPSDVAKGWAIGSGPIEAACKTVVGRRPKGTGMLWVRADRRDAIHPLVVSHGANADLEGRTRFRHEFDWVGTADPTGYLALPAAIDWMRDNAAPDGGGWPAVMAANRALAIEGRDRVAAALDVAPPAPDSMLGSMATLPLEAVPDEAAARSLGETLERSDRIQVPVGPWPVRSARNGEAAARMTIRLSAQRYNEPEDYDRLADALRRHLGDPRRAEP